MPLDTPPGARAARALLLAAACAAVPAAAQEIYRWRDANGRMHYSDRAPAAGAEVHRLQPLPAPVAAPPEARTHGEADAADSSEGAGASGAVDADAGGAADAPPPAAAAAPSTAEALRQRARALDERQAQRRRDEAEARAAAARRAERQRLCGRLENRLAALESGQRAARLRADGGRDFIDDVERAAESARLRERLALDCR